MQRIITLTERKATEAARRAAAVATIIPLLSAYAREHDGRFLLYGSAARGQMKYHSDVDLLLDFPDEAFGAVWDFAENACWDRGLEPDLLPYRGCKPAFLDHIAPDLRVLECATRDGTRLIRQCLPRCDTFPAPSASSLS